MKAFDDLMRDALARVPMLDRQALLTQRTNAVRQGAPAAALVTAIDERLGELDVGGGMAVHRLEFARAMLRMVERGRPHQWVASRDLFERAKVEHADNTYAIWMGGNSARQIPLTKALADVLPEFPTLEWRKDGVEQGARVYYRLRGI